jgi:hypothetical protein
MSVLKDRATVEDLLELPQEGWQAIAAMDEAALEVYLADAIILEPKIPADAIWRGGKEPKEPKKVKSEVEEMDDENPIKLNKKGKGKKSFANKNAELDEEAKNLFGDLDEI